MKKITAEDVRNHSVALAGVPAAIGGCSGALVNAILKSVINTDKVNFIGRSIVFIGRWGISAAVAFGVGDKLIDVEGSLINSWNHVAEGREGSIVEPEVVDIHDNKETVEES